MIGKKRENLSELRKQKTKIRWKLLLIRVRKLANFPIFRVLVVGAKTAINSDHDIYFRKHDPPPENTGETMAR